MLALLDGKSKDKWLNPASAIFRFLALGYASNPNLSWILPNFELSIWFFGVDFTMFLGRCMHLVITVRYLDCFQGKKQVRWLQELKQTLGNPQAKHNRF
jgi:hypothetical protein